MRFYCCLFIAITFLSNCLFAQSLFHLNVSNGLPSNNVYYTIQDRLGYLWIGTQNGLLRYNGYNFKVFDRSQGLPCNDIWTMYEDRQGRIWLYTFAASLGYMYNDKYHAAYLPNAGNILYPQYISQHDSGIQFSSPRNSGNVNNANTFFREYRDTLTPVFSSVCAYPAPGNRIVEFTDKAAIIYRLMRDTVVPVVQYPDTLSREITANAIVRFFNNDLLLFRKMQHSFRTISLDSWKQRIIKLPDSMQIVSGYAIGDKLYLITPRNIVILDTAYSITGVLPVPAVPGNSDSRSRDKIYAINYFFTHPWWGHCFSTPADGLFIDFNTTGRTIEKLLWHPHQYDFLGAVDKHSYWWNATLRKMAVVDADGTVQYHKYDLNYPLYKVLKYSNDSLLLLGLHSYWLHTKTKKIAPSLTQQLARNGIVWNPDELYLSLSYGLIKCRLKKESQDYYLIDRDRYTNIVYDSARNFMWAYHSSKLIICRDTTIILSANQSQLSHIGISNLEDIIFLSGNVIAVKCDKGIYLFHLYGLQFRLLFQNLNLSGVKMYKSGNDLLVAGNFGAALYNMKNKEIYSVFNNEKGLYYDFIENIFSIDSQIFVHTNKGIYSLGLSDVVPAMARSGYSFILSYNDSLHKAVDNDTLHVLQKNPVISLDLIRPLGLGVVHYAVHVQGMDSVFRDIHGNEFILSQLQPGQYYQVSVVARDKAWRSDPQHFTLYIIPYWWQTTTGYNIIILLSVVALLIATALAVFITRKNVARRNYKKQMQLELEIKSIHSQINPHFIFNTLNTSLDFIRSHQFETAYGHVFKFSQLLRSYLKSSRNRYISLAEEIENLKNYIELQQSRFGHVFSYRIVIEGVPDTSIKLPSLLLQPLVENAINHGLLPKEENGMLTIRFSKHADGDLHCIVEDNGVGRAYHQADKTHTLKESYGNKLIKELMDLFNKHEKTKINLTYIDKQLPLQGTIVHITIHYTDHGNF